MNADRRKRTNYIVLLLFGGSVLLRFLLGNFYPRTINCYPDELLYLSLGESLWNHHNIQVFNVASYFRKATYPLLIAPAFAFGEVKMRGMVIALVNAIVISLGIFPVYGLAKRILNQEKYILLCATLYILSPTMTYSMTYMSENLAVPLALLFLYLVYRVWEEKSLPQRMCLGVLTATVMVLCYMTKSVDMSFPVALVMVLLTVWLFEGDSKKRILAAGLAVIMIAAGTWVGFTRLFPAGMMDKIGYAMFGFLFFVVISLLGFCVIPVLLPGMSYRKLDEKVRWLYLLLVYIVLITAAVVACMIYVTEDYPSLTPRAHLRYIEYLFVPFAMLTFHSLEKDEAPISRKLLLAVLGIWAVVFLGVFRGFSGQTIDQTLLFYWQLFARDGKIFSTVVVKVLSAVIIVLVIALMAMRNKSCKTFQRVLVLGLVMMSLGNSALSIYVQYKTHTHTEAETVEMEQLREFVREHEEENFLVLEPEQHCEMIDTFLVDCDNVRTGMGLAVTQRVDAFEEPTDITYIVGCDQICHPTQGAECVCQYPNLGYSLYLVNDQSLLED